MRSPVICVSEKKSPEIFTNRFTKEDCVLLGYYVANSDKYRRFGKPCLFRLQGLRIDNCGIRNQLDGT